MGLVQMLEELGGDFAPDARLEPATETNPLAVTAWELPIADAGPPAPGIQGRGPAASRLQSSELGPPRSNS